MFADIASRYDRANSVLSLGIHKRWRRRAVRASGARRGDAVLDIATGTGDLAFAFKRRVGDAGSVVGSDFCQPMLDEAILKRAKLGLDVRFEPADALDLPYDNDAFDVSSIAFGIRNVDNPGLGVAEMARVTKPGGRVVVLEFGQPGGLMAGPYRAYSRLVMPRVGGALTGHREAYEYLPETAAAFPSGQAFVELMQDAATFSSISATPLTGGIAWLYVGTVAAPA